MLPIRPLELRQFDYKKHVQYDYDARCNLLFDPLHGLERKQNRLIFVDLNYYFKPGVFLSTSTSSDDSAHGKCKMNKNNSNNSGGNRRRKNSIGHQIQRKHSIDQGHNHNARKKQH